jgi:hypothetical protein
MEWGSVAELLSAFGTLAALGAAAVAARAAIRTNNQQSVQLAHLEDADKERSQAAERAQAEKVACWISLDKDSANPRPVWINGSGQPVYNATFFLATPGKVTEVRYAVASPSASKATLFRAQALLLGDQGSEVRSWEELLDGERLRAAVVFRDTGNRWWLRGYLGHLSQHPTENAAHAAQLESYEDFVATAGPDGV